MPRGFRCRRGARDRVSSVGWVAVWRSQLEQVTRIPKWARAESHEWVSEPFKRSFSSAKCPEMETEGFNFKRFPPPFQNLHHQHRASRASNVGGLFFSPSARSGLMLARRQLALINVSPLRPRRRECVAAAARLAANSASEDRRVIYSGNDSGFREGGSEQQSDHSRGR